MRGSRAAKKLATLLIAVMAALALAEILVRWVAPQGTSVPMIESVAGVQVHRANLSGSAYEPGLFSVTYHTNGQRFRARRDYPPTPPAGVTRIVAIGDSFCFGFGVEDDQSYPAVMEKLLARAGKSVEVINAGQIGTGTGAQALWYDGGVAGFRPEIVVLSVFVNDIAW